MPSTDRFVSYCGAQRVRLLCFPLVPQVFFIADITSLIELFASEPPALRVSSFLNCLSQHSSNCINFSFPVILVASA